MRFCAAILFSLMTVVLPTAGVERHFCTMSMAFVESAADCPGNEKECCGKTEQHAPADPGCMISAKLLPDAEMAGLSSPKHHIAGWDMLPAAGFLHIPEPVRLDEPAGFDRGPPAVFRLYLAQRGLLI